MKRRGEQSSAGMRRYLLGDFQRKHSASYHIHLNQNSLLHTNSSRAEISEAGNHISEWRSAHPWTHDSLLNFAWGGTQGKTGIGMFSRMANLEVDLFDWVSSHSFFFVMRHTCDKEGYHRVILGGRRSESVESGDDLLPAPAGSSGIVVVVRNDVCGSVI